MNIKKFIFLIALNICAISLTSANIVDNQVTEKYKVYNEPEKDDDDDDEYEDDPTILPTSIFDKIIDIIGF
jgi:hypothetical protein